jgi:hypothetical protein
MTKRTCDSRIVDASIEKNQYMHYGSGAIMNVHSHECPFLYETEKSAVADAFCDSAGGALSVGETMTSSSAAAVRRGKCCVKSPNPMLRTASRRVKQTPCQMCGIWCEQLQDDIYMHTHKYTHTRCIRTCCMRKSAHCRVWECLLTENILGAGAKAAATPRVRSMRAERAISKKK